MGPSRIVKIMGSRTPMMAPAEINQRWSLDFVSDTLADGRRFRVLCVPDDFSRECLTAVVDTSLGGMRVVRELELVVSQRGWPHTIVSDNGTELTSNAVLRWAAERVSWHYIQPGKPVQNAFIESFNSKLRDECLRTFFLRARRSPTPDRSLAPGLQPAPATQQSGRFGPSRIRQPARGRSA
jgi:putative transposase